MSAPRIPREGAGMREEDCPLAQSPDTSPAVRSLLQAGIADEVTDYDYARGLAAHMAAIGAPLAASTAASVGKLSGKALGALVGAPIVALSVAAAVWFSTHGAPTAPSGSVAQAPAVTAPPPVAAPAAEQPVVATPFAALPPAPAEPSREAPREAAAQEAARREPAPALGAGRAHGTAHHADSRPGAAEPAATPLVLAEQPERTPQSSAAVVAPSAPEAREVASRAVMEDAPEVTAQQEAAEAERRAQEEAARKKADDRLARDMDQLVEAKRALSSDPAKALTLARQGQREFPGSLFAEERQHILLLGLIGVGRVEEAANLAAPYLRNHPGSPFARRVQSALDAARARRAKP